MAINEENGRNVFDPSKRIKGKLGGEFVQSAESDAFEKLKLVASSSGMRATSENNNDSDSENVKFGRVDIVHSSKDKPFTESNTFKVISRRMYTNFADKKNFVLGYKQADHKLPIINNVLGVIPGLVTNSVVNNVINTNKMTGSQVATFGVCALGQFGFETLTRLNRSSYNKNFEGLNLTDTDTKVVNKVAFVESAKRAGLEVAKETVVPTVIKLALNKFMPENVKNSVVYKIAVEDLNAPRIVTSTVGTICYNQYAKKIIDKGFKADATISDMARSCAVSDLKSRISVSNLGVEGVGNVIMRVSDIVKTKKEQKNEPIIESKPISIVKSTIATKNVETPKENVKKSSVETPKKTTKTSSKKAA